MTEPTVDPLDYATRFDIPIPGHPGTHVVARKARPGYVLGTQWAVTDDSDMGSNAWTGHHWVYRGELHREQIYAYDRDDAIAEAIRVAPLVAEEIAHRRACLIAAREQERQA